MLASSLRACPVTTVCLATRRSETARQAMTSLRTAKSERIAAAFCSLAASPALALMHRYETRLHLVYQRSLHNLLLHRTLAVPNEPSPISGHLDPEIGRASVGQE